MSARHPPSSTPIAPTHPRLEDALDEIDFPATKREIMDELAGLTVVFRGKNVEISDLIRDIADDEFRTEDELREALDDTYGAGPDETDEPS